LRLTLVTHLSNFFEFRPFLTPLGINIISSTYLIKINASLKISKFFRYGVLSQKKYESIQVY
jgi:hypothetical protein